MLSLRKQPMCYARDVSIRGNDGKHASTTRGASSRRPRKGRRLRDAFEKGWIGELRKKECRERFVRTSSLPWTTDQIAGMFVGFGLLALAMTANRADEIVAKMQRESLGICVSCGGIGCEACSNKEMGSNEEEDGEGEEEEA